MSLLFKRVATINIDGREFESPPFSIEFEIEIKESGLGSCKLKLYNPAPETVDKTKPSKKERAIVSIEAGYEDDSGRVYLGEVVEVKESFKKPDRILEVGLVDVSANWTLFPINQTFQNLPASGILKSICGLASVEIGKLSLESDPVIPKIYISNFEYGVKFLSEKTKTRYYVKYGKVFFDKLEKGMEKAFVLNSKTGLIGSPELFVKNNKGSKEERYKIKTLFNYKIQNGSILSVDYDNEEKFLKVVCGKHTFSSFGNCYSELETVFV